MRRLLSPRLSLAFGAFACVMLAILGTQITTPALVGAMAAQAPEAIAEAGGGPDVKARFVSPNGWPSRHPVISGGEGMSDPERTQIARAVAAIPGVAGIRWADGSMLAESDVPTLSPMHCQKDVQALLQARSFRFEESSARIDAASRGLVDEVADALAPCLGAIIAITGHTDSSGPEPGNLALSQQRADAVRAALVRRGIPADGLRAEGLGSARPVAGLDAGDPANRRIEFSVIATEPITPTPVDTPGPR